MPKPLIKINICPFCGGFNVKMWDDSCGSYVKCNTCGTIGPIIADGTLAQAVKAWNIRHDAAEIPCVTDDAVYDD